MNQKILTNQSVIAGFVNKLKPIAKLIRSIDHVAKHQSGTTQATTYVVKLRHYETIKKIIREFHLQLHFNDRIWLTPIMLGIVNAVDLAKIQFKIVRASTTYEVAVRKCFGTIVEPSDSPEERLSKLEYLIEILESGLSKSAAVEPEDRNQEFVQAA